MLENYTWVFAGFHSGAVARGFHSDAVAEREELGFREGGMKTGAVEDNAADLGAEESLSFIFFIYTTFFSKICGR